MMENRIPAGAEYARQVGGRMPVDGDAERMEPLQPGLRDGLSRVLHPVAALVQIHVVRLTVGEQQEQAMPRRLLIQSRGSMPKGCTHPRISVRLESGDTP